MALAALGAFTAASDTDDGMRAFVVARTDLEPGRRLTRSDLTTVTMRLGRRTTGRAYADPDVLVGAYTLAPLAAGELVQAGSVSTGAAGLQQLSFAVDRSRAVGGRLRPGEAVDVLATFGTGVDATTRVVARAATVVALDEAGGLGGGEIVVTLGVADGRTAQAVAHAAAAADVTLVRSYGSAADDTGDAPVTSPSDDGMPR